MPTALPVKAVVDRRLDIFVVALILLYAACALALCDEIARGLPIVTDLIAAQADPGL